MKEYDDTITATSTEWAPWYVVPADHKWVSGHAVVECCSSTCSRQWTRSLPPPAEDLDGLVVE